MTEQCFTVPQAFTLYVVLFQDSVCSYVLKGLISLSTVILLGLIVLYHTREIQVCNKWMELHKCVKQTLLLSRKTLNQCNLSIQTGQTGQVNHIYFNLICILWLKLWVQCDMKLSDKTKVR